MDHAWQAKPATGAAEIQQQTLSGLNDRYAQLAAQIAFYRAKGAHEAADDLADELAKVGARRKAWFGA